MAAGYDGTAFEDLENAFAFRVSLLPVGLYLLGGSLA
jgi:hypothetical protein